MHTIRHQGWVAGRVRLFALVGTVVCAGVVTLADDPKPSAAASGASKTTPDKTTTDKTTPDKTTTDAAQADTRAPAGLPDAWLGHWKGPATLHFPGGRTSEFWTELVVKELAAPTGEPAGAARRYSWTIIYAPPKGEDGAHKEGPRQERAYELVTIDAAKGRFDVDEKNGIVIPQQLLGDAMWSHFEVQGTRLSACYRLERADGGAPRMVLEIISMDASKPATTGGKDGVPEVLTLTPGTLQRAVMARE